MSVGEVGDVSARREGRAVRAFFAWAVPEAARAEIAEQVRVLRERPNGDAVRWVRSEGYHVTLRFLGNVALPLVPELVEAVRQALLEVKPFAVRLGAPQPFPSIRRPRVIVLSLEPQVELAALAERLEAAVVGCGLRSEKRRFQAHLTLGRLRNQKLPELGLPSVSCGPLAVHEAVLFQSELGRDGSRYSPLAHLPLAAAATLPRPAGFEQNFKQGEESHGQEH
jgi:2'-5' RNA ligase